MEVTACIRNTLDMFHRRCIRKILGLSWQDRVTNEELMRRSGMQALSEIVQTRRLRLAGHVLRLPDVLRPARVAMTWIPESGRRTSGRPQMTWRTSFNYTEWTQLGMVQGELPRIDTGGEISTPNVPSGTGGTKFK